MSDEREKSIRLELDSAGRNLCPFCGAVVVVDDATRSIAHGSGFGCPRFHEAMAEDPATVAERISWMLDGNYGYGQMVMAKEAVAAKRMNREALLTQMVGVFEWQCPRDMSRAAWTKLTPAQKKALSAAVAVVIKHAESGEE